MNKKQMNKYHNKKTAVDGITFDSRAESQRYIQLKLLQKCGKISNLKLQPHFELQPKFTYNNKTERKIEYIADFSYFDLSIKKWVVEDVKGIETAAFKLKRKLFLYKYGSDFIFKIVH